MAINFFQAECQCKTKETVFGIIDSPPSKVIFENPDDWHVWVDNSDAKEITHTAIDFCIGIPPSEGERCESMITYEDVLMFIELKDRDGGRWAGKASDQLKNTIALFIKNADITVFNKHYAHIANKRRPHFKAGGKNFSQRFEDETGFVLRVSAFINIE